MAIIKDDLSVENKKIYIFRQKDILVRTDDNSKLPDSSVFNLLKENFSITVNNLMSYNSDLARLKNAYVNNVSTISEQIKRKATTIRDSNTW